MNRILEYIKHYYHKIRYSHSPSRMFILTDLERRRIRENILKRERNED